MSKATATKKTTSKIHFEEWQVEVKGPATAREVEKVRLMRKRVLMSQDNADILNDGVLNMDTVNNNRLPLYYFPVVKEEQIG